MKQGAGSVLIARCGCVDLTIWSSALYNLRRRFPGEFGIKQLVIWVAPSPKIAPAGEMFFTRLVGGYWWIELGCGVFGAGRSNKRAREVEQAT